MASGPKPEVVRERQLQVLRTAKRGDRVHPERALAAESRCWLFEVGSHPWTWRSSPLAVEVGHEPDGLDSLLG